MSLKLRLDLLFALLLLLGLAADIGRMTFAARDRVQAESEAMTRVSRDFVVAALANLQDSAGERGAPDAENRLRALVGGLAGLRHVRILFTPDGSAVAAAQLAPDETRLSAPVWFYNLIGARGAVTLFPVALDGHKRGDLVISGDPADEVNEVWQDVRSLAVTGGAIVLATVLGASFIIGRTLGPLADYGRALGRLRDGDYAVRATPDGSPEFVDLCGNLNALAEALQRLSADNRALIRRLMQAQEQERKTIAHDLHDEIGPHLFALRAQAALLRAALPAHDEALALRADAICGQVEALQGQNRRILRQLRPPALDELGLAPALRALVESWRETEPDVAIDLALSGDFADLDAEQSLALYRLVQEALTNIFRHAGARAARVRLERGDAQALARIEDDGKGFAANFAPGLGLAGMKERLGALGGALSFGDRPGGGAFVEARLPL